MLEFIFSLIILIIVFGLYKIRQLDKLKTTHIISLEELKKKGYVLFHWIVIIGCVIDAIIAITILKLTI